MYNYVVEPGLRPGSTYFHTWLYSFPYYSTYFHNRYREKLLQKKLSEIKPVSSDRYFLLRFFYFNSKQDH
jgi:hypothetical protein